MLSDLMQQKGVLIGAGVTIGLFVLMLRRRSAPGKRPLDVSCATGGKSTTLTTCAICSANVPTIVRPALLMHLHEIERQVH